MRRPSIGRALVAALACAALAGCAGGADSPGREAPAPGATGSRYAGPQFDGAGDSGSGQSIAAGLDSVHCSSHLPEFSTGPAPGEKTKILCFYGDPEGEPAASIEWVVETAQDSELVHIRLTLDPSFVDNSYGTAAVGWDKEDEEKDDDKKKKKGGHTFKNLVGSDHAEMRLTDASGQTVLHFKADYISEDEGAPSGYASLGVSGGDGKLIEGDESDIVKVSTSLDRNLNECGLAEYVESSPMTDEAYSLPPAASAWDYRVVYDIWVKRSAFGAVGFGEALIDTVHASPSKSDDNTIDVTPDDCPPDWGYCEDPNGCECNPLDDGCGGDGVPPGTGTEIRCEDTPEGCESPD